MMPHQKVRAAVNKMWHESGKWKIMQANSDSFVQTLLNSEKFHNKMLQSFVTHQTYRCIHIHIHLYIHYIQWGILQFPSFNASSVPVAEMSDRIAVVAELVIKNWHQTLSGTKIGADSVNTTTEPLHQPLSMRYDEWTFSSSPNRVAHFNLPPSTAALVTISATVAHKFGQSCVCMYVRICVYLC